jgi:DNA-binding transcriptional regulator YhcF (GntR family)
MLVPERDKADGKGEQHAANSMIANPPTHMEIAIMLNISRETVTRVFQSLQNRQIVKRDGPAKLLISDLNLLKRYAEGSEELG